MSSVTPTALQGLYHLPNSSDPSTEISTSAASTPQQDDSIEKNWAQLPDTVQDVINGRTTERFGSQSPNEAERKLNRMLAVTSNFHTTKEATKDDTKIAHQLQSSDPATTSQNKHGNTAAVAEENTRQMLDAIPKGELSKCLNPDLIDQVHLCSYQKDSAFDTMKGKLTPSYALAWLRGKHAIEPMVKRTSWAAAPASITLSTYTYKEIHNVESYGAQFFGLPYRTHRYPLLSPCTHMVGKTLFRDARNIARYLHSLCAFTSRQMREAKESGNEEAGWKIAATFKQEFIAIHPYMDGNGRVSRLLTERILSEFGLQKPNWNASAVDLNLDIDEVIARLKHSSNIYP